MKYFSKKLLSILLVLAVGSSCSQLPTQQQEIETVSVTDYVNPFIGTLNKGNTYPGAVLPWGMASPNPQTKDFRLRAGTPATYEHGDPFIYGFSSINLSGVGCPGGGSIPIKLSTGELDLSSDSFKSSYNSEVAEPGYYKVILNQHKLKAEMTATKRSARYNFSFNPEVKKSNMYIDLASQMSHMKGGEINVEEDGTITGYQLDGEFCDCEGIAKIYFALEVIGEPKEIKVFKDQKEINSKKASGKDVGVALLFDNKPSTLDVKVGISFVSVANAKLNLSQEQRDLSFEDIKLAAKAEWEKQLSKVEIAEGDITDKTVFYTALYHSIIMPHVISDINGEYPLMEKEGVGKAEGYTRYSAYSLWDTYRSVHPLNALLYPKEQRDMTVTMLEMYKESGWLPKWELYGNESWVMVGDPAVPVIVDTYMKGITDFDTDVALEAMLKGATTKENNPLRPGIKNYIELGYCPIDDRGGDPKDFTFHNGIVWGPVSTTLEYNFADYTISKFAEALGKDDVAKQMYEQSMSFKKLYDAETQFFRPKTKAGEWMEPFNPLDRHFDIRWKGSGGKGYCEGTAWQYRFFVPHAMNELKELMGEEAYFTNLEALFEEGHFDLSNEPDITFPYLFNYLDKKHHYTQKYTKAESEKYFKNAPIGIPGNDDAGTMSAWLVMTQLGIFPDAPGIPTYQLTTPKFNHVQLHLDEYVYGGKVIALEKNGQGDYFDNVTNGNGETLKGFSIEHKDLINSGKLVFNTQLSAIVE
ncbi:GH92 family glycosyl hydrolase [Flammeovirga yaeyamensis]|uniref:GH92 family glycosyl hydrolase n=1 Tax=Flammeovirga yaeyamensis TaxID=367791 RepID=A0AAX1NCE8_9BACT|nr:GH92 family glycosyl hydrolase [Flammeovirga yaeyamensis]MBB3697186.1 putative alpha-1,2-mannosidase [Flammeovirga yaeyamensis]NMF33846.1 glycoside hydrolase family 92 protein [Flammeovirga yaeyamensis]QWG04892.1 GH92 family glycosyl hydrolase [Flammeovirga yaeyamensis]